MPFRHTEIFSGKLLCCYQLSAPSSNHRILMQKKSHISIQGECLFPEVLVQITSGLDDQRKSKSVLLLFDYNVITIPTEIQAVTWKTSSYSLDLASLQTYEYHMHVCVKCIYLYFLCSLINIYMYAF